MKDLRRRLRENCLASRDHPSKVLAATLQGVSEEVKANMGKVKTIKRDLRRLRQMNSAPLPKYLMERNVPNPLEEETRHPEPMETVLIPEPPDQKMMLLLPEQSEKELKLLQPFEERTIMPLELLDEPTLIIPSPFESPRVLIPKPFQEQREFKSESSEETRVKQEPLIEQRLPGPPDGLPATMQEITNIPAVKIRLRPIEELKMPESFEDAMQKRIWNH